MKLKFYFTFLFAVSTLFFVSAEYLTAEESYSLFQSYLAACNQKNSENQPVHLRNACQEKEPNFIEMTILNVHSMSNIDGIAERILYGNADVVHFSNISTEKASHFYEMFQNSYSHFIYAPSKGQGDFVASKYPLSEVEITQLEREDAIRKEILEFSIHGANVYKAHLCSHDSSIQLVDFNDIEETIVLLDNLPAALTIVKHQSSPFQIAQKVNLIAKDTFDIVPIRRGEGSRGNDDKSGPYCEGRIDFKTGPNGVEWSASGRAGYEDEQGNFVEGQISRNDKGETSGSAKAGNDRDK